MNDQEKYKKLTSYILRQNNYTLELLLKNYPDKAYLGAQKDMLDQILQYIDDLNGELP